MEKCNTVLGGNMARSDTMIHVRLAPELKEFICLRAKDQERSVNAHVVFLIRQEMEKEKASDLALGKQSDASHHHE